MDWPGLGGRDYRWWGEYAYQYTYRVGLGGRDYRWWGVSAVSAATIIGGVWRKRLSLVGCGASDRAAGRDRRTPSRLTQLVYCTWLQPEGTEGRHPPRPVDIW